AGRGDPAEVGDGGQELAGAGELLVDIVPRPDAAVDGVDDGVVTCRPGVQNVDRGERLALGGESDLDRVVHAAPATDPGLTAVGPAAEDAGGLALHQRAVGLLDLVPVPAVAPVEPAVGAEERPVNVGRVAGEAELRHQLAAAISDAGALAIDELPQAGRRG